MKDKVIVKCNGLFCAFQVSSRIKKGKVGDTRVCPDCGRKWQARLIWVVI